MRPIERRIGACLLVLERGRNGASTARLAGELDRFDTGHLTSALRSVVLSPAVSVDLDGVTFLDLAAARALHTLLGSTDVQVVASAATPCGRLLAWLAEHERNGDERP